ncbi:MAG: adenylate/guanylate cyclase domain-containing protein [Leptospiraceae bacterium]|nr:adenylate/guanylate cyclase domain-containing protein [Leptospiraceae bacterium]
MINKSRRFFQELKKNLSPIDNELNDPAFTPEFPIQAKLVSITAAVFLLSTSIIIGLATYFFRIDNEIRIKENQLKLTEIIALAVKSEFKIEKKISTQMASLLLRGVSSELLFENDSDIVYLGVYSESKNSMQLKRKAYNQRYLVLNELTESDIETMLKNSKEKFLDVFKGKEIITNVSKTQKVPFYAIAYPYIEDGNNSAVLIILRSDTILKVFEKQGISESFLIDDNNKIVFHPDMDKVLSEINLTQTIPVKELNSSTIGNGQIRYKESNGEYFIGAFKRVNPGNLGIITIVSEKIAYEEIYNIQKRNILIAIIAFSITIGIMFFFAKTISRPILKLLQATIRVSVGNFKMEILPETNDEIGLLTDNFIKMGKGLEEREKIKEAFGRFVNPIIAERVLTGEVNLGGEEKTATILFTDIRGFTELSENFTPTEIVEFLNKYLTLMVDCVDLTFGIVDKFIGDAIMATWGATPSIGNPAENGINAALMMRFVLIEYNEKRIKDGRKPIKMGCGLNHGPVVAGQIGSESRLEFTVIGDAVNLASRIESLNKPFATDILISEDLFKEVEGIFIVEEMKPIKVKGKAELQKVYAVIGRYDDITPGAPKTLAEVRKQLGIVIDEKVHTYSTEEEKKYEIIN